MEDKELIKHLIRIENKIDSGFDSLDNKIGREISGIRNEMNNRLDEVLVIVHRLDQERVFTQRWIHRLEEDVARNTNDISQMKKVLKIA